MTLCPLQIHSELPWDWTWTCAVNSWWLTAWVTSGSIQTLEVRNDIEERIGNALFSVWIKYIFCSHTFHNVTKDKFLKNTQLFIRLQINKTILRGLYAFVKRWALAQSIICYVSELTTVQHISRCNCPVSYHRTSNNNIKFSSHCWSSNSSVGKVTGLWVGWSGLLFPAGSSHVLLSKMSAVDLASYSMDSCLEGKGAGV